MSFGNAVFPRCTPPDRLRFFAEVYGGVVNHFIYKIIHHGCIWFNSVSFAGSGRAVYGGADDDPVDDGAINGTDGDDELTGTGGDDILNGLGGNDTLRGGAGDATLNGGDGSDVLAGWHGNDTLNGGAGVDQFVMGAGADHGMESYETSTITDFDPATESIEINHPTEQTPDSSRIQLEQDGVDTLVILTDPDTADRFVAARLSNVSTGDIQAGSILFSAA